MNKLLKKLRRYRELQKKQHAGFSPEEEIALLRLHKMRPANKKVAQICFQIRKRYFFCIKREIFGTFHTARIYDDALITALLSCGNTELISHYRRALKWNEFLTKLDNEHQSYLYEKPFLNSIPASDDYYFEENLYINRKYTWIFNESKARNEIYQFRPSPRHIAAIKALHLVAVEETYRNLEKKTQFLWQRVFKKYF